MSAQVGAGQTLKILDVRGRSMELDEHGLARLLLDERVKDKPVVVLAVVGAFRKGKSFLLCFLLQYLRSMGRTDWLSDPDAPLEGFEWRGGSDRHTTGILMWNEVFLVKNSEGDELAVLLVDTQGTFDCQSSTKVHSSIFALSAMISSVLVYNVSQNIQEDDLQHLQAFIEYGTLTQIAQQQEEQKQQEEQQQQQPQQHPCAPAEVNYVRPFQSLLFLVRDWGSPYEIPFGAEGGQRLLEKRLRVTKKQDKELRDLRRKITKCFTSMRCFLMPYPGTKVAQESSRNFRLSYIDKEFKRYLCELMLLLLEPDNLLPKEINGRRITCRDLFSYIKKLNHIFDIYCEYLKEKKREIVSAEFLKTVAFKAAHGFVTGGLAAGAIALAVVELPAVAIALGAVGAVSLSGHLIHVIVEKQIAKRKRREMQKNALEAAEAVKCRGACTADNDALDDETSPLLGDDDAASVLSADLLEFEATSPEPPVASTNEVLDDCDDSTSVLSMDAPAFETSSPSPSLAFSDEEVIEEHFKNFFNQNREKLAVMT
ncbi:hypothetical protein HPB50_002394 [Hyalomma asiaticum]|uniref:Uncharacterized protein n=1 Tax=Hyalomma asiaticum TaxID=266040 RepID=A0ACB7RRQ7_HYAAI|nr:hypothetical protein HPB50_002394 [Hyalomma asiaticum]